jgi:hypothetical protein
MLGLAGFEVLAAGEVGRELELLVQTTGTLAGLRDLRGRGDCARPP